MARIGNTLLATRIGYKQHSEGKFAETAILKIKKKIVLHIGVVPIVPYRIYVIVHEK